MGFRNVKQMSNSYRVLVLKNLKLSKITVIIGFILSVTSFQNCSKIDFAPAADNIATLAYSNRVLDAVNLTTKKNQAISFNAGTVGGVHVGTLSLSKTTASLSLDSGHGHFEILDSNGNMKYTPHESYVGSDVAPMYVIDPYGNNIAGQINITVGNNLNTIQPALAVRGMSCITCHSQVSSNIITDYGFGNSWYFDSSSNDSFYLDRANSNNGLATLSMLQDSKIIVPAAPVPQSSLGSFNFTSAVNSLADFIKARFSQGAINSSEQVIEVPELKISIPTASRIREIFGNPSAVQVYLPDTQSSPALSGLNYDAVNRVFVINHLVCDGDLYLGAPTVFSNATVESISGCRIYSTSNIFITSPIQSIAHNGSQNYNTQILSAQSIWMGAGRLINDEEFCEVDSGGGATGWYASTYPECASHADQNDTNSHCDTLTMRMYQMLLRNTYSRAYPDQTSLTGLLGNPVSSSANGVIMQDRAAIEASLGRPLYDAACGVSGRNRNVSRLMLVAPYVNNRYTGDYSGSTIAESALMSLGTFVYHFDPVFTKVSILSLLENGELISGQGL